jgi:hypothetical protein
MNVVQQGRIGREALFAHKLLGVEATIGSIEADVTLSGNLAGNPVVRHIVSLDVMIVSFGLDVPPRQHRGGSGGRFAGGSTAVIGAILACLHDYMTAD